MRILRVKITKSVVSINIKKLLRVRICFNKFFTEAEFKEFETRLKYGFCHLKSYLIFQDLIHGAQFKLVLGEI